MKITVFTSNQPRHISLVERLAAVADRVHAVIESTTVFPGKVDDFYKRSEVMQRYFQRVIAAERELFGSPRFLPSNVQTITLKMEDLSSLPLDFLSPALDADVYVVFGASYIKGALCEHLVANRALNIHMGVSPYYRGSSCNFWAVRDGRPDLVGATIHLLSKGLDSGPMLFHALPAAVDIDPFILGMRAVKAAHEGLAHALRHGELQSLKPLSQDRTLELRYSRNAEFNDAVAEDYLNNPPTPEAIGDILRQRKTDIFLNPYIEN